MKKLLILILNGLLLLSCKALAAVYYMPPAGTDLVGYNFVIRVQSGDNVTAIRKRYEVSYNELVASNPRVNFYRLRVGQNIIIPQQMILPRFRQGIVVSIAELRMYYFTADGSKVYTFPVGLGREDWRTPTAEGYVVKKETDPVWHPPKSIREYWFAKTGELLPDAVDPGPKNPLGKYALRLSVPGYLIHGTNQPDSVGTYISSGCVRLLSNPLETIYDNVSVGTPVHFVYYPNKAGWQGDKLYLESHPTISGYEEESSSLSDQSVESAIHAATNYHEAYINWGRVEQIINQHNGMPQIIGRTS
jgi:L,D-transpeptidase ErfK/SrfK